MKALIVVVTGVFAAALGAVGALGLAERPDRTAPRAQTAELRRISRAELGRHASAADCWIAVRGAVYDVTRYIDQHPAPVRTITDRCGTDATVAFETKNRGAPHSPRAWEALETMHLGEYEP